MNCDAATKGWNCKTLYSHGTFGHSHSSPLILYASTIPAALSRDMYLAWFRSSIPIRGVVCSAFIQW